MAVVQIVVYLDWKSQQCGLLDSVQLRKTLILAARNQSQDLANLARFVQQSQKEEAQRLSELESALFEEQKRRKEKEEEDDNYRKKEAEKMMKQREEKDGKERKKEETERKTEKENVKRMEGLE